MDDFLGAEEAKKVVKDSLVRRRAQRRGAWVVCRMAGQGQPQASIVVFSPRTLPTDPGRGGTAQ